MRTVHKRTEMENLRFLLCKMCFLTQKTSYLLTVGGILCLATRRIKKIKIICHEAGNEK